MREESRKRVVLLLRWAVIIVTSYLILFGKGRIADLGLGQAFILIYLLSNVILSFLPGAWFSNPKLFYSLVLFDTAMVSFGMYLSESVTTDFYLVFFLIIIFASMSRNYKLLMAISGITACLYGALLFSWGLLHSEHVLSYILRIPFIFIMAAFYGYSVRTFMKEKQQQLTISEDKYRGLFENAHDGIIILRDPHFLIADINQEVERLTGYEKEELLRKDFIDLFGPMEKEKAQFFFEEALQSGEVRADSISLLKKDGMPLDVDLSIKRIDLGDESFCQVIFRDLTDLRLAQENAIMAKIGQIVSSTLNIEEVYERFAETVWKLISFDQIAINVINHQDQTFTIPFIHRVDVPGRKVGDVIPLAGTAAEWVMQNRSSMFILEENWEEVIGRFPGLLPLFQAGFRSMMLIPLISKDQVIAVLNLQKFKKNAYAEADLRLAERVGTQIAGAIANAQLFNERKRAEEQIRKLNTELQRQVKELMKIDKMKSEFISIASHELRTPLAAIKNAVQLVLNEKTGEINENQSKFLSMADRNINRLTNILNNILDLAKIESGKMEVNIEDVDLRPSIEFILSSFQTQADEKSLQLKMEIPEDFPNIYGNREKIEQILTNLVGNALKFTPEGGEVSVSAKLFQKEKDMVVISIRDSGIGIAKNEQEKIFEKFYQAEGSLQRSVGGTGLGLSITKGLVEAHQGKIWVESEVGKGSTFSFSLRVSKGERRDRRFRFILDREFQRAQENHSPLTLSLIEILKEGAEVNDDLFDQLEEKVKQCLCRDEDILIRRKKEKTLAALCRTDLKGSRAIHQRIRKDLEKHAIRNLNKPIEIKIGAAAYPDEALSKRELFRKAKEGLTV